MTKVIKVGKVLIGGGNPISIQSMTNTKTKDAKATIKQINDLEDEGCELVRIAVSDEGDLEALKTIKENIELPLIVDIQFDYKLAVESAKYADCIRVNPGNIGNKNKLAEVVSACKYYDIPIRIGVNSGSVSRKIVDKYGGVNADSLLVSAGEELSKLESLNFYNTKVSIKSSDVPTNILVNKMFSEKYDYPLHLGVTEAGNLLRGSIKSAIGIGSLLSQGIGDTIRVSLSDDPIKEVMVAKQILQALNLRKFGLEIVSCPTCSRTNIDLIGMVEELESRLNEIKGNKKIAVMGCVVNGPGEAKEADYGITGLNSVGIIFKNGEIVERVNEELLIDRLIELINMDVENE